MNKLFLQFGNLARVLNLVKTNSSSMYTDPARATQWCGVCIFIPHMHGL